VQPADAQTSGVTVGCGFPNLITFHRFTNFRSKTMADSAPMPDTAQVRE